MLCNVVAVKFRHLYIHQDNIIAALVQHPYGSPSVVGTVYNFKSEFSENISHQKLIDFIVLNNQNPDS